MASLKVDEKKLNYRSKSPNPEKKVRSHRNVEVCTMGAVEIIGMNLESPRRYFCCGSLLLLVLAVRIYTLVQLLC